MPACLVLSCLLSVAEGYVSSQDGLASALGTWSDSLALDVVASVLKGFVVGSLGCSKAPVTLWCVTVNGGIVMVAKGVGRWIEEYGWKS